MYNIDEYLANNEEELEKDNSSLQNWREEPLVKIEKMVNLIKVLEYQNNDCDTEIKRIQEVKKSNEKKIENIKKYLASLINKPTKVGTYTLSTRKSESIEILDETKVPMDFLEEKITLTISKKKIKDYLDKDIINNETGEIEKVKCDWARINYNTNLIIK
ncbi:siphovirus Gp157 family protein [bacterium]|nr:siphovirus Gp157 family protein [bacterium]